MASIISQIYLTRILTPYVIMIWIDLCNEMHYVFCEVGTELLNII
jgi:hypothetical protein